MQHTSTETIGRHCAFIIQVDDPVETLQRIALFCKERGILIDHLNLHRYRNGDATVIIHCKLEKDRIYRTVMLMEKTEGVRKVEKLVSKE